MLRSATPAPPATHTAVADDPGVLFISLCDHGEVTARQLIRLSGVAALAAGMVAGVTAAPAAAEPCPDVETIFARGTDEPAGLGPTGQAFVDALRPKLGAKSLRVYPVNYPASNDWPTGIEGIRDASDRIQSVAATCPNTKMVLGGFSQGAAVMGFVTADAVPDGVDGADVPRPMPAQVADHVAAVVLFGTPNARAMDFLHQPAVTIGPLYAGKTLQLCEPEDPVCSEGLNFAAHTAYAEDGIVDQAAAYAANRV